MENYKEKSENIDNGQSEAEKILGSMPSFEDFRQEIEKEESTKLELDKLAEKYEYGEELKETLEKIVPEIIEYYDDQETVIKALNDCPIFMLGSEEGTNNATTKYFGEDWSLPTIASGGAVTIPSITEDGGIEIKKGIVLRGNFDDISGTLVHEICHQIAAVNKEPHIESGGKIRINTGLASEFYEQNENGDLVQVGAEHVFLEEIANTHDTEMIMKKIVENYDANEYGGLQAIADACPPELIPKLNQVRRQVNPTEYIHNQKDLEKASQSLDDFMNVPRRMSLSRKLANGDEEKRKIIKQKLLQDSFDEAVKNLTLWIESQ